MFIYPQVQIIRRFSLSNKNNKHVEIIVIGVSPGNKLLDLPPEQLGIKRTNQT